MTLRDVVSRTISEYHLLQAGERCFVALSGGADSVALLSVLHRLGYDTVAAHCNFHLRGAESDRDEDFCRTLCREIGVEIRVCHFDTTEEARAHGESIEMAARRLRYAWFRELCQEEKVGKIAVGHHSDDNTETVLLNLVRGTGISGLTGMDYERDGIIRPLLDTTHDEITAYLEENHLSHIEDSSNTDTRYKRNLIRHEVIPLLRRLNPSLTQTMRNNMSRFAAAEEAYLRSGEEMLERHTEKRTWGDVIDIRKLTLRAAFDAIGRRYGFPQSVVDEIARHESATPRARYESTTHLAAFYRGRLEVCPQPDAYSPRPLEYEYGVTAPDGRTVTARMLRREELTEIPGTPDAVALDYDRIVGMPFLRRVLEGDRFEPFGMKGSKLVSDFLTDRHVSQIERLRTAAVADENGILWVVGHRPSRRAAITPDTTTVLLLKLEDNS